MDSDHTISQWFAAMIDRQREQIDPSRDQTRFVQNNVQWDHEVLHSVNDVLRAMLQQYPLENGQDLSDSLSSPSLGLLTQPAQIETNHLLAGVLANLAEGDSGGAPVTPYAEVADMGLGLSIYNAAFLPGWPPPAFAKNPNTAPDATVQHARNEAEVVAYLTEQGLNKDLLSRALAAFKKAEDRIGFLVWLGTLISVATATLATLRKEAADPDHGPDLPKSRKILEI